MDQTDQPQSNYISAVDAARLYGLTNDHVASLCRKGKVDGMLVGRVRYVKEDSLQKYLQSAREEKENRYRTLSNQIKSEQPAPMPLPEVPVVKAARIKTPYNYAPLFARARFAGAALALVLFGAGALAHATTIGGAYLSVLDSVGELQADSYRTLGAMVAEAVLQPNNNSSAVADGTLVTPVAALGDFEAVAHGVRSLGEGLAVAMPMPTDNQKSNDENSLTAVPAHLSTFNIHVSLSSLPDLSFAFYFPRTLADNLAGAYDAAVVPVARAVVSGFDSAGRGQASVITALGNTLADAEVSVLSNLPHMQTEQQGGVAVAAGTLATPIVAPPNFNNITQGAQSVSAALEAPAVAMVTRIEPMQGSGASNPPQNFLPSVDLSFAAYLPGEVADNSAQLYDNTFGALARAYVAGVYGTLNQQAGVYEMLGTKLGDAEAAVAAHVPGLPKLPSPALATASVWDSWTGWLAQTLYPARQTELAVGGTDTSTKYQVPSFPIADSITNAQGPTLTQGSPRSDLNTPALAASQPLAANFVTPATLDSRLSQLENKLTSLIYSSSASQGVFVAPQIAGNGNGVLYGGAPSPAASISSIIAGLTAADIPALNYFPSTSTIAIEYGGTGTSTRASANKLLLSDALGNWEYVSTSSLGISGGLPAYASSTALTVSGVGYFGTASTTNLTVSGLGGSAGQCLTINSSGNVSATSCGATGQWTTQGSNLYYNTGGIGIGSSTPSALLTVQATTANVLANGLLLSIASSTATATTTFATFDNTGKFSIGASTTGIPTGIFSVDAASGSTTISNLSVGNLSFAADAGQVQLSDIPVDAGAAQGVAQSQSISIGGNPLIVAYGESDGAGGTQNLRVGLGTSTPYARATIWGSGSGTNQLLELANAASTTIARFLDNGTGYFAGPIGIGTTSPGTPLAVNGAAVIAGPITGQYVIATSSSIASRFTYASTTVVSATTVCISTDCRTAWPTGSAYPFNVINNATSTLTQFNGGLTAYATSTIGDGTANGGLTISGGATTTGNAYFGGNTSLASAGVININSVGIARSSGTLQFFTGGNSTPGNTGTVQAQVNGSSFELRSVGSFGFSGSNIGGTVDTNLSRLSAGVIGVGTGTAGSSAGTLVANTIGLGTTSPYARLSISNSVSTAANTPLFAIASTTNGTATSTALIVTAAGNVGIGTASPAQALDVDGNINATQTVYSGSLSINGKSWITSNDTDGIIRLTNFAQNDFSRLQFGGTTSSFPAITKPAGIDALAVNNADGSLGGAFGVGTSTPWGKVAINLDNGETNTNAFIIASSTASATTTLFSVSNTGAINAAAGNFAVDSSGNVQLGLTSNTSTTFLSRSTSSLLLGANSTIILGIQDSGKKVVVRSDGAFGFSQDTGPQDSADIILSRLSAGVVQVGTTGNNALGTLIANTIGIGTTSPFALFSIATANGSTGSTLNLFAIASSTSAATTTFATFDNTGKLSIGASATGIPSGIFTVDASSSTTTISNLSVGNIAFDTDAGVVQLSDIPVSANPGAGTVESQSISIGGNPIFTAYGENDGSGGVQNLRASVGTTSPYARLSVFGAGTGTGQLFELANAASTTIARFLDNGTGYFKGQIGIGSTSPWGQLSVDTSNLAAGVQEFVVGSSTRTDFVVNQAGNVGIGSTSPSELLTVQGSSGTKRIELANTSSTGYAEIRALSDTGDFRMGVSGSGTTNTFGFNGAATYLGSFTNNPLVLATNNIVRLVLDTSGNVGIGTTSPYASLSVSGASGVVANLFAATSTTATNYFAGLVAIGTTTPYSKLSVWGANTTSGTKVFEVTNSASTTNFSIDNAGFISAGASNGTQQSNLFTIDASTGTTTIANLSIGNLTFDTDAGIVNLSDIPVDANAANGVQQAQIINIGGTPVLTVSAIADGLGGTRNWGVGIGTSSIPYSMLQIWGQDQASSTSAFAIVNNASTTVFAVFDGGNAQLSGTLTQSSDARLKTNVTALDASSTLNLITQLTPVSYNWINPQQDQTPQMGFIAQEVQKIFPGLVATTSPTALTPDGTLGVNYIGFIAPIIDAIKALVARVDGFASSFTTKQLCVADDSGAKTCVSKTQLDALLQMAGQQSAAAANSDSSGGDASSPPPADSGDATSTDTGGDATTTTP